MNAVLILVLGGGLIVDAIWTVMQRRAKDLEERRHHALLMKELRRHGR